MNKKCWSSVESVVVELYAKSIPFENPVFHTQSKMIDLNLTITLHVSLREAKNIFLFS